MGGRRGITLIEMLVVIVIIALLLTLVLPAQKNGFTGGFVVLPYPLSRWIDFPAILHPRGTCLSFADGHCEFWQWVDERTRALDPATMSFPDTPDNQDLIRLQGYVGQAG